MKVLLLLLAVAALALFLTPQPPMEATPAPRAVSSLSSLFGSDDPVILVKGR